MIFLEKLLIVGGQTGSPASGQLSDNGFTCTFPLKKKKTTR